MEIVNNTKCCMSGLSAYTEVRCKHLANLPHHIFDQVSPLFLACYLGNNEFALSLLRAGASPDLPAKDNYGGGRLVTPLYWAAYHSNTIIGGGGELFQALIGAGATMGLGVSPLQILKSRMKPELVKIFTGNQTAPFQFKIMVVAGWGIAVTAVINLPASGGRKDQPYLHSYLIL